MARRNIKIKWKYNIGDNIVDENRNLTITDRYVTEHTYLKNNKEYVANIKHYKYICNICGFNDGDVLEGNLCNKKSGFVWMYYKEYLDKLEAQKNDTDIFGGLVGDSKNDVATSQDICNNKTDEVDLSWLDELA